MSEQIENVAFPERVFDNKFLTQSDKQVLLSSVKVQITFLEDMAAAASELISKLYPACDKADPRTKGLFDELNMYRSERIRIKKRIKRLATVAKNLKKELT